MNFRQFNHLNVPEHWERYWSKYPQGMTILESLFEWVSQVNDMVDSHNKLDTTVSGFRIELDGFIKRFEPNLQNEVTKILSDWQASGFLKIVIDEALQTQIDKVEEKADQTHYKRIYPQKLFSKILNGQQGIIVFLGDSTTELNFTTNGQPNHVGLIETYLKNNYGSSSVQVINSGVSGNTTLQMRDRLYKDVIKYKPDMVCVSTGINDSGRTVSPENFKKQLEDIIKQILATNGTDTDIVLRTSNIVRPAPSELLLEYQKAMFELATKYNLIFVDYLQWQLDNPESLDPSNYYDSAHPNELGQSYIAELYKHYIQPDNHSVTKAQNIGYIPLSSNDITKNFSRSKSDNVINGEHLSSSKVVGAKEQVTFYGTGFTFNYTKAANMGMVKVTLDNVVIEPTFDCYAPETQWTESYTINNLADGKHVISFELLAEKNPLSTNIDFFLHGLFVIGQNNIEKIVERKKLENVPFIDITKPNSLKIGETLIQWGFSAVPKNGELIFPIAFTQLDYVVSPIPSGTGGESTGDSYEDNIYFTGSSDYSLDRCRPKWSSTDAVKGLKWVAIGK